MTFLSRWKEKLWWIAVPLATLLFTFGPYWAWNLAHAFHPWWRVSMIAGVVFDTPFYLEWIGEAVRGAAYGDYLKSFGPIMSGIAAVLPGASVDEWWLVSGWLSAVLFLFTAPWGFRHWTGLSKWESRAFALASWLSACLILGMRPGVYSWYFPFCLFGMTAALNAFRSLEAKRVLPAIGWSILAAAGTSSYVWFLIAAGLFLLVSWAVFLFRVWPRATWGILVAGVFVTVPFGIFLAHQAAMPKYAINLQMQERHGLAYTHMPFLTNSVLLTIGWIVGLVILSRLFRRDEDALKRLVPLQIAWLIIFFGFQLSAFTGIYIHNDHFRAPALLFSWITLGLIWTMRGRSIQPIAKWEKGIAIAVFAAAVLYAGYILQQPYALNGDYLNALQLSHWFALVLGSGCVLLSLLRKTVSAKGFFPIVLTGAALIGGLPTILVLRQEMASRPDVLARQPLVDWVKGNIPSAETACADPKTAEFLSAHAERRVYPAPHTRVLPESDETEAMRTRLLASAYDVEAAGAREAFLELGETYRGVACVQYPLQSRILRTFGVSESRIRVLTGCPEERMRQDRDLVAQAIARREFDEAAFAQTCPWVIIPAEQRAFWKLPSGYTETRLESTSIWHRPPSL